MEIAFILFFVAQFLFLTVCVVKLANTNKEAHSRNFDLLIENQAVMINNRKKIDILFKIAYTKDPEIKKLYPIKQED